MLVATPCKEKDSTSQLFLQVKERELIQPLPVMGTVFARLWWGGDPNKKNPVSGLSRRDVYYIQKTWAKIYANGPKNGYLIFSNLFKTDPETRAFFRYLAHVPDDELEQHVPFKAHIVNILSTFNVAVENVNTPEIIIPMMDRLGISHQKLKIRRKHFMELRAVIVNIYQKDLHFSSDVMESWARFIDFMYKPIFERITEP